jgi:hypothetical protein
MPKLPGIIDIKTPEAAPTTPGGRPLSNVPLVKPQMGGYQAVVDNFLVVHRLRDGLDIAHIGTSPSAGEVVA